MISRLFAAVLVLLPSFVLAADPVQLGPGVHYLRVTVSADGGSTVEAITPILLSAPAPGGPAPIPPMTPIPTTGIAAQVRLLTEAQADPTTARALAKVYELVRLRVADGSLPHGRAFSAVGAATDAVLSAQQATAKWKPWRDGVTSLLSDEVRQGKLSTQADHVRVLGEVEAGLVAAGQTAALFDKIDIEKLIRLIELIIKLIATFS